MPGATVRAARSDTRTRTPTEEVPPTGRPREGRLTTPGRPANCRGAREERDGETGGERSGRRPPRPGFALRAGTIPTGLLRPLKATVGSGRMALNLPRSAGRIVRRGRNR